MRQPRPLSQRPWKVDPRRALFVIPVAVVANLLITFLQGGISLHRTAPAPGFLALGAILGFVPWFTHAARLRIWTRFLGLRLSWAKLFAMVVGTELGSAVTPTAVGGGWVKAAMLVSFGMSPGQAISLMTLGSLEDGIFLGLAVPASLLATGFALPRSMLLHAIREKTSPWPLALAALALVGGGAALLGRSRAAKALHRHARECREVYTRVFTHGGLRWAWSMALTGAQWACRYTVMWAVLASLGQPAPVLKIFPLQWLVFTMGTLVPTPGGLGGIDAAFFVVHHGVAHGEVLRAAAPLWRLLTSWLQLAVGAALWTVLWARCVGRSPVAAIELAEPRPQGHSGDSTEAGQPSCGRSEVATYWAMSSAMRATMWSGTPSSATD